MPAPTSRLVYESRRTKMKKELLTSVCALSLLFGATAAGAGTYSDKVDTTEGPTPPPAPPVVEETVESDYARNGVYLGAGALYAVELFVDGNARVDNSW